MVMYIFPNFSNHLIHKRIALRHYWLSYMYLSLSNIINPMHIHAVTERIDTSAYLKYCGSPQEGHPSHLLLSYFYDGNPS